MRRVVRLAWGKWWREEIGRRSPAEHALGGLAGIADPSALAYISLLGVLGTLMLTVVYLKVLTIMALTFRTANSWIDDTTVLLYACVCHHVGQWLHSMMLRHL